MENYEPSKILNKNFEDKMWLFGGILHKFMYVSWIQKC